MEIGDEIATTNHLTLAVTGYPTQSHDVTTQIVAPSGTAPCGADGDGFDPLGGVR